MTATSPFTAVSSSKPAPAKRRRRWFQFSLRSLTIFMVVCSLLMGAFAWRLQRARKQAQTVAALRGLGCNVQYDFAFERTKDGDFAGSQTEATAIPSILIRWLGVDFFHQVHAVNTNTVAPKSPADVRQFWTLIGALPEMHHFQLRGNWLDHDGFTKLSGNQVLQHVWLSFNQVRDSDLAVVGTMPNVRELHITGFDAVVTDAGIASLDDLEELRSLQIDGCRCTDVAAQHLAKHPKLVAIHLTGGRFTDESTAWLSKLTQLKQLSLSDTQIGDAGLANLSELTNLTSLGLGGSRITDAGLVHLREMKGLESLDVGRTQVHGPGLVHLTELPKLQYLGVNSTQVTDSDLAYFTPLTHLETLSLMVSKVTDDGMVAFDLPPGVKEVHLPVTSIGDRTLQKLSGYPNLTHVWVSNTKVTPQGIADFKKALPGCRLTP